MTLAELLLHWPNLTAAERCRRARRVVLIGAESTGKTTLAQALADHYRQRGGIWAATQWVEEYGRTYTEEKVLAVPESERTVSVPWTSDEFTLIAERQIALEDEAAAIGSPLLICDTDPLATQVWHERYLGGDWPGVEEVIARSRHALWLLTESADVPFEADNIRDGEHLRQWMTNRFRTVLRERSLPFVELHGSHEHRLRTAVRAIDALLQQEWLS